jgi:hypothetical protein
MSGEIPVVDGSAPDKNWQRLWFSLQSRAWSTLAIVPTDVGTGVTEIAERLSAVGQHYGAGPIDLLDAVGAEFADTQGLVDSINETKARGRLVLVACDPLHQNPPVIPIVRSTSGVLLVVHLGESRIASARKVVEIVGRERILGAITLGRSTAWRPVERDPRKGEQRSFRDFFRSIR